MPCRKDDHNHEWPSTGLLTIVACETICYLCESTKEYKPASALRKHVQRHIRNDKLPLSLSRSASGRPKLSTRGLTVHRQTAVVQSPAGEQEPQESDSTPILTAQQVEHCSPLEQPAQHPSDAFAGADLYVCTVSGCYAHFDTTATFLKQLHESHPASPDGPALPPTTADSSIAYNSTLRVEQSSTAGAAELDAPLNVLGANLVERMRMRTSPAEATHKYMKTPSSNEGSLSYVRPSSPGYDPLHSPPCLELVHPRLGNEDLVGLPKVQRELIAPVTPTIDPVEVAVENGRMTLKSCEGPVSTPGLSGSRLHRGPCWRCSILSLECRPIDQTRDCDMCQRSGTTLRCFGFRLEHLLYQILDCDGDFPRVLQWEERTSSQRLTISFTDRKEPFPSPMSYIREQIALENSWLRHKGWSKAFCIVIEAANHYRITDSQEHKAIEKGLEFLNICVLMLWRIVCEFQKDNPRNTDHATPYLRKSDLRDFLCSLFNTTIALSESGQNGQFLDVFYGTLIANHDPTFLDGPKSPLYQPMLLYLEVSMPTSQKGNAHFKRAAAAVHRSTFGPWLPPPQNPMSMYSYAVRFLSYCSQESLVKSSPYLDPPGF